MPHVHFLHHHGRGRREVIGSGVRKGCLAIMVGQGAEQRRFVIPVEYLNHPRFTQLLKEAEEEYGFNQEGAISIPCHVEEFSEVTDLIDKETASHQQHNHHHHHFLCFKAS
ncbi:auxin-responsive protein SAUR32-like [Primulina tabacum]|uniref:auxin-responsive protein SAUR32-like n=1 Tax=Primulina tabacum TaxID=48773 RepID=UPI003F596CAF